MESVNKEKEKQFNTEDERFILFKQWFKQNGGLFKDINFPVHFEPGNYIGIGAKNQIRPNSVIIAVPKQIVVSISKAKSSELKDIFEKYQIFENDKDDDSDYNILCLFLIMQKMKGPKSFFGPYIKLLESSQTVMNWTDSEIEAIKDPYINIQFINSIRNTFEPIFNTFVEITQNHKELFPEPLSRKMFDEVYAAVMTRGFGWGLPETMLVPFADFLNHSSSGVNHYVFDKCLQKRTESSDYIKKKYELNLSIFSGLDNEKILPIDYEPNIRQKYIEKHKEKLEDLKLTMNEKQIRMNPSITNPLYHMLVEPLIEQSYEDQLYLSTDSEDNDSDSETEGLQETDQIDGSAPDSNKQPSEVKLGTVFMIKKYLKFAFKQVQKDLDQRFTEPKPTVNAQFQDGVKFDWWFQNHSNSEPNQTLFSNLNPSSQQIFQQNQRLDKEHQLDKEDKEDKYFIVSTSKTIYPNQQIFNCYGRRSNRFLLIWYGFCFQGNKYDSVPFRIWSPQITKRTGKTLYTKFLTQTEFKEGIPIGNQRYNAYMLSQEFRLKNRKIDYKLIAFLRYRFLKSNRIYKQHYKSKELHINTITSIDMEIECFLQYQKHLHTLMQIFDFDTNLQKTQQQILNDSKNQPNGARKCFRQILQKSNQQILIKNLLAVNELIEVLQKIQTHFKIEKQIKVGISQYKKLENQKHKERIVWINLSKQLLLKIYQSTFKPIQIKHQALLYRLLAITGRQKNQIIRQLKIMVREYFKHLSQSEVCRTLYTEFE